MSDAHQSAGAERRVSSVVDVEVAPDVAFAAFTEELDLWWVRGPINHWAAGRMREMRIEAGVGGRALEVYDDDALELGRITAWEPGKRVAWSSSVDDVETDVSFEPTATGTTVRVVARIPEGGQDRGGTAWTRVVPKWFGAWCARGGTALPERFVTWLVSRWGSPTCAPRRRPGGWPRCSASSRPTLCPKGRIRSLRPNTAIRGSSSAWATAPS